MDKRAFIAKNAAALFHDGDVVNLGIGIPTLASTFVPDGVTVFIHAEDGVVGCRSSNGYIWDLTTREGAIAGRERCRGELGNWRTAHKDLVDASGDSITLIPGAACFDSTMAFAIARGGRLDATVLGALQVDQRGNLANWKIPGKKLNGMGGAMDIVSGAGRVIIAMEHVAKNGEPKIRRECTLPLTAVGCVNTIVTDLCVINCGADGLTVVALAPGVTREDVLRQTEAELRFAGSLAEMLSD